MSEEFTLFGLDELFKRIQFSIETVYDIGAHKGEFTSLLKKYAPDAKYYLFEPSTKYNDAMKDLGQVHNVYLSNEKKNAMFWGSDLTSDSFYQEFTGIHKDVEPVLVQTETLDEYVESNNLEYPMFIKIDTQGSEIDILKGGQKCLENAVVIVLECSIIPYNNNNLSFKNYIDYMLSKNFIPFHVIEIHSMNGVICQLDIAFINTEKVTPNFGGQND